LIRSTWVPCRRWTTTLGVHWARPTSPLGSLLTELHSPMSSGDCYNSPQCDTPTCVSVEWRGAQEDARAAQSIDAALKLELRSGRGDIRLRTVGGTRKMRVHPAPGRGVRRLRGRPAVIETEQSRHYSRLCLRRTVLRPRRLTLTCMHNQGTRSTSQHSRSVVLPRRPEGMIARGRCEHALGAPVCTRTTITRGVTKAAEMCAFGDMQAGPGKQQRIKG